MLRFYNKKKTSISTIVLVSNFFMFLICIAYLGNYYYQGKKVNDKQKELTDKLDSIVSEDTDEKEEGELVDRYAEIRDEYPDLVGRIIFNYYNKEYNLPLMQTEKEDGQYYLYRNYQGEDSKWGTPFIDYRCDVKKPSANFILYGHNMKDLSQFGSLSEYKKKEYWEKYPTIKLETMYRLQKEYEIFAAFYGDIYEKGTENVFKYYNFIDATDENEYNEYVKNVKKLAEYDTGITPEYGEQLITLSTCDSSKRDDGGGRFVVVARKKKAENK